MWIVLNRAPKPDAAHWTGRRLLAALDAVLWPALFVVLLANAPARLGIVGPLGITVVVVVGAHRLARAVWRNERYRFTTWRWGRAVALVLVVGFALKLLIA